MGHGRSAAAAWVIEVWRSCALQTENHGVLALQAYNTTGLDSCRSSKTFL